jgi:hypothetical protein
LRRVYRRFSEANQCDPNLFVRGIDHERLTCFYQGRRFRLTDVHGKVVEDLIA